MEEQQFCACGKGNQCCQIVGNEDGCCGCSNVTCLGWTDSKKESFASRANRALYKISAGKEKSKIVFSSEGREICAFVVKTIRPLVEFPRIELKEELFVFLGIWDEPKTLRFNEKNLANIEESRATNLFQILDVSLARVSYVLEMEGVLRAGLIKQPFDK